MDFNGLKEIVKDLTQGAEQRALSRALKSFSKGQIDKAIEILVEARQASPENPDILFDLCRYQVLANRGGEASEALRAVLRRHPRTYPRATEMIEELRAKHANVSPLFDAIAEHFIRQDDLKNALDALERLRPEELRVFLPRHQGKWDALRKSAPDAKLAKTSLQSAYYLALCHEALREYDPAATIYRLVAKNNPEELPRVLDRLEALLARDYQNAALRCAVGDLHLRSGREEDAVQQFTLLLETDPRGGRPVAERVQEYLREKGEKPELRWVLVTALLAAGDEPSAIEAMRPLVDEAALLNQVVPALEGLVASEKDKEGQARLLLASALARRGQPQAAVEILVALAEAKGLPAIRGPLEAIVASGPGNARVFHLLADVELAEGRADAAVECLRKARDLAPQEESLLVPRLVRILESHGASPGAHLLLAEVLDKNGERDRALVILRHLVREAPASSGEALERFATILKEDAQSPRARIGAAEACLELKLFPECLAHLREVAAARPDLAAEYLRLLAALAEAASDQAAGVADVLRGLESNATLPQGVRFALGEALFFAGQLAPAGAIFRDLLQAAPERTEEIKGALQRFDRDSPEAAEACVLLATLCLDRRDYKGALAELARCGQAGAPFLDRAVVKYEQILASTPDDIDARLGFLEALVLTRRFDRVLSTGSETLKLRDDETTARVYLAMGDALRHKGDSGAAVKRYFAGYGRNRSLGAGVIERLRGLIAEEGTHPLSSLALGKVLSSEGRPAEAVEALGAARAADPKLSDAVLSELERLREAFPAEPQSGLAMLLILAESGDNKKAVQVIASLLDTRPDLASVLTGHLDRLLKADPQQAFAAFQMGRALQHLKLLPRSAAAYMQAFRLDPTLAPLLLKGLHEMMSTSPSCLDPYLAACAIHAARGKFPAAASMIERALEQVPDEAERLLPRLEEIGRQNKGSAPITLLLADACMRAGRHERALAAYGEAARRDPGLADRALAGIEAILKAAPNLGEAYLWRARFLTQRLQVDRAVGDLQQAARLKPELGPQVIEAAEALRSRAPESHAIALLLADHYAATSRESDAARVLDEQLQKGGGRTERLAVLVRLWRLAMARGDDDAARHHLGEASRLAADRNQFLLKVHETQVAVLRASAGRLRGHVESGSRRGADVQSMLRMLVDLGEVGEAAAILDRHAAQIDAQEVQRLRADLALRKGDYARAAEHLAPLGASRTLAFAAERAGDHALAARTLEALVRENPEPGLEVALNRVYRDLVGADLMGGRRRLMGETSLTTGEGAGS
jgi:tetratricopeptide (TPR) repeat protein